MSRIYKSQLSFQEKMFGAEMFKVSYFAKSPEMINSHFSEEKFFCTDLLKARRTLGSEKIEYKSL